MPALPRPIRDGSLLFLIRIVASGLACGILPRATAAEDLGPGLAVRLSAGAASDQWILPALEYYVAAGQPASPFIPPGPWTAYWSGFVTVDLRSDMYFQAEARGRLTLTLNGEIVMEYDGQGGRSPISAPIRLGKGTNALEAMLTAPANGEGSLRIFWGEEETSLVPVPRQALHHDPATAGLREALERRRGRELALEYRCFQCHAPPIADGPLIAEASMDAPSLTGIGSRRHRAWMESWIAHPQAMRPQASMPARWTGPDAAPRARAVAAFLSTLTNDPPTPLEEPKYPTTVGRPGAEINEAVTGPKPETLFEALQCQACHSTPNSTETDPEKIPLHLASQKFPPGQLEAFLQQPHAYFKWIRMPDFNLTSHEARELATFIRSGGAEPPAIPPAPDAELVAQGRRLVQESGCLNCHSVELENQATAPTWSHLQNVSAGCLAATDATNQDGASPHFNFHDADRAALRRFVESAAAGDSVRRHVPAEFAERQTRQLGCARCHGPFNELPPLDQLGVKLRPEWTRAFLAGTLSYRPRPWLYARMPFFPSRANALAEGLAQRHGLPPHTPPEPPVQRDLARLGRAMVGKDNGFSCVSCHAVGNQPATEVFEAEGVNLQYSAERLQKGFYHRWLLNPSLIDPQTKMPMYFSDGFSPLTEILEGDALRQIDAMWEYLRLGPSMVPPAAP